MGDATPSVDTKLYLSKYAIALKEYRISELENSDKCNIFDTINEFRAISGEAALHELETKNWDTNDDIYINWSLEAQFWHLLDLILSFRAAAETNGDQIEVHEFNSAAVYEKKLLLENKQLYELWLVIACLQSNLVIDYHRDDLSVIKWQKTMLEGGLKSSDLDYPLRDRSVQIDAKDLESDEMIHKYIYQLILSGKIDEAVQEAKNSENFTLAMILCGLQEYVNPVIDFQLSKEVESQQGLKKHALWRRTVYSMSKNQELQKYERAIYSFLAGDIPSEEVLNEGSWDMELLCYLNQLFQTEVESYLIQQNKIEHEDMLIPIPIRALPIPDVLNRIATRRASESEHPIRVLISSVILNTVPSVIHSSVDMLMAIVEGVEPSNEVLDEPYLLKIVSHLAILFQLIQPGKVDTNDITRLISAYISVLKLKGLQTCIPIYMGFLTTEDAQKAYMLVLSTLQDQSEKRLILDTMQSLKLPVSTILNKTTELAFADTESSHIPNKEISIDFDITAIDCHLIYTVEWLIEAKMVKSSVEAILVLSRRFLINGKISCLELLLKRNDINNLLKSYETESLSWEGTAFECGNNVKELVQYQRLIQGFKEYKEWQNSISLLNEESNIPSLVEKFHSFTKDTKELISTFLVELTEIESHESYDVIYEIRALYTPYFIIELHKSLVEAAKLLNIPKFIKEALSYTTMVANETDKVYLLFQSSGKLAEYLQLIARTATAVK